MDDVTTTGNSLYVCKEILLNRGAANVEMFALGKEYKMEKLMEEKKTWAVGAGSGIGWLKALLVSYLISVLLLLLLSFLLWKFLEGSWVQAALW